MRLTQLTLAKSRDRRRGLSLLPLLFLALSFPACDNAPEVPDPDDGLAATRQALNENVAKNMILPSLEEMKWFTERLDSVTEDFLDSPNQLTLSGIKAELFLSYDQWQRISLFSFGPAESVTLRQALNTYPTDTAKIQANIASGSYVLGSLDNMAAMGFPALDYLINGTNLTDSTRLFASFTTAADAPARRQYLRDLVLDINNRVQATLEGWTGAYSQNFISEAASGTDVGSSLSLLVNAMDAHLQRAFRDGKIAIPAGIRSAGVTRPTAAEAYYGGYSWELFRTNLAACIFLYEGKYDGLLGRTDEVGLYDYLVALEAQSLADDIRAQFTEIQLLASSIRDPLSEVVDENPDFANQLFLEIQKLVVLFKADMASVMGISITNQDNDGD